MDDNERVKRMAGADVFCAPSLRGESFGIVLLEAMAAGTAVVASDIAGYSKVTYAGRDGALFPAGNASALASILESVLTDRARRDELIQSGAKRVGEFSMQRLADLYLESYERAIAGSLVQQK